MTIAISGTNGITLDGQFNSASSFGFKNRIINGAMLIDQRNAGASVTPTNAQYTVDRWICYMTQASKYTVQQNAASVTPPAGFINYLGITSSSAYSVLTGDTFYFKQAIEGLNCSDLAWGTASAATVTLSFWVRSSLTGTFGGSLFNNAGTRSYPFSYTISSANTWEQKSVTIAGDTTGTWLTTNSVGINVGFGLGSGSTFTATANSWAAGTYIQPTGSTSVVGTNGATFYITGVQLEKGSTATSFDYRPYGTELQLAQRYFLLLGGVSTNDNVSAGQAFTTTSGGYSVRFPVAMRTTPTLDTFTASNWSVLNGTGGLVAATAISLSGGQTSTLGCQISATVASGLTAGQGSQLLANTVNARLPFNSEL